MNHGSNGSVDSSGFTGQSSRESTNYRVTSDAAQPPFVTSSKSYATPTITAANAAATTSTSIPTTVSTSTTNSEPMCSSYCFTSDGALVVDLHGFTAPIAKAAVHSALHSLRSRQRPPENEVGNTATKWENIPENRFISVRNQDQDQDQDASSDLALVLITGIGRNSKEPLEPVLKPLLRSWLATAFNPPLMATEMPVNPGRYVPPLPTHCLNCSSYI